MKQKSFAVLGLGKYGYGVAKELMNRGAQVLVADKRPEIIEQTPREFTEAVNADLSDPKAIRELGLGAMDAVIVAMATDLEASIMCVMLAKEAGVHRVIAKAETDRKGDILKRVGADEIIYPERESGMRTAFQLMVRDVFQFIGLSSDLYMIEMLPKPEWVGRRLADLNIRSTQGINVIAIRHENTVRAVKDPYITIEKEDSLLIVITKQDLDRFIS